MRTIAALLLVLCVAAPRPASAQPADEGGDSKAAKPAGAEAGSKERARAYYVEARRQHESGDYAAAAENYLAAYKELPKPAFLYNAAQVFRLGGQLDKALEHYRRYLELEPDGEGAAYAREFVASIEKKIAEKKKAAESKGGDDTAEPSKDPGELAAPPDPVGDSSGAIRPDPIPVISADAVEGRGRSKRMVGLALAGTGVALIGAGIGFGFYARSLSQDADNYMGPFEGLKDIYDKGEAADRNMVILLSAGAVTAAAGGLIYFLGIRDRNRAERDLELFAAPEPGGLALGLTTRWP